MKASKFFMIGVSVTALVFGMTVVSCGGGGGAFTLTNIPLQYNGMYAFVEADSNYYSTLLGAKKIDEETEENTTLVKISNGKVSIPMWAQKNDEKFVRYSDNDKVELEVTIFDSATLNYDNQEARVYFDSVVFSKGNATKSFHDGDLDSW
jgi:hypothetical protein